MLRPFAETGLARLLDAVGPLPARGKRELAALLRRAARDHGMRLGIPEHATPRQISDHLKKIDAAARALLDLFERRQEIGTAASIATELIVAAGEAQSRGDRPRGALDAVFPARAVKGHGGTPIAYFDGHGRLAAVLHGLELMADAARAAGLAVDARRRQGHGGTRRHGITADGALIAALIGIHTRMRERYQAFSRTGPGRDRFVRLCFDALNLPERPIKTGGAIRLAAHRIKAERSNRR